MYGIYANIGGILMVNVTIYSIHGSYGIYIYILLYHVLRLRSTLVMFITIVCGTIVHYQHVKLNS